MDSHRIEKLIAKYLEAKTTLEEEASLKDYFAQNTVAPHLEEYAPMFQYFAAAKQEEYTQKLPIDYASNTTTKKFNLNYKWLSIAAMGVLMFGIYFANINTMALEDEYTQEEIAQAQQALSLLSMNFNKGSKQLTHLKEFEKNTNKFLIKK